MERLSPERVMRVLQAHDVILSIEEAKYLIDFSEAIMKLAEIR